MRTAPAFSLIELLAVIAIIAVLLTVATQIFSNTSHSERQAARDIIKGHLHKARAHAIASGNATAVAIPEIGASSELGGRAISLFEVQKIGALYEPIRDDSGRERMLQRWETLPGNFHFIPSSILDSTRATVIDQSDRLQTAYQGNAMTCHVIVFAPTGQIVAPTSAIHIAIARASSRGGSLVPTEKSGGRPVYEFFEVNRLSGRTRSILP